MRFFVTIVTSVIALLIAVPAFAQADPTVIEALDATGFYLQSPTEGEQEEEFADLVAEATASGFELKIISLDEAPEDLEAYASEILDQTEFGILALSFPDSFELIADAEANSVADLDAHFVCANNEARTSEVFVEAVDLLIASIDDECGSEESTDETEEGRDKFGAETLELVLAEIADDETYVGPSRTDIDEEALIAAVRQINAETGLRLIVVAPDNPQPSANAFALRIQQRTKAEVLLFPEGANATSSVTSDPSQPRSADINASSRNQSCATQAVWDIDDEAQAVIEFGQRLSGGCGFEPPTLLIVVLVGTGFFAGLLGLIVIKEKELRAARQNEVLPPPSEDDLVMAASYSQRAGRSTST